MELLKRFGRITAGLTLGLGLMVGSNTAAAADVVKLGFTGPLSGGAALYGKNTLTGIEMAVNEINKEGGLDIKGKKYKVEVVALDDKYSPSEAAVNAKRLVQEHKTPVIFVPHSGGIFALQAFNEQENFLISAYTSIPTVTSRGNKLTVRIPPSFLGYMAPFTKVAMERFGKRVAIANATHDYAKAWTKAFVPAWTAAGGEVVADNPMDYNKDTDYYSGVSKVLAAKPDVLFIGGASEPSALVVKQARELGFKGGFIVMDQAKLDEMAAVVGGLEMLEGAVGVLPLVYDEDPEAKDFVKRYQAKFGKTPGSEAGYHYMTTYIMVEAMKIAGTTSDPAKIRAAIGQAMKAIPQQGHRLLLGREQGAGRQAGRAVHRRRLRADRPGGEAGPRAGLQGRLHRHGPGQARRDGRGGRRSAGAGGRGRYAAAGV
jgi:ABC-type branched-chain amino acid transport systems, periplasmic component